MTRRARDFSYLRGRLLGISDRALMQHLELYEAQVAHLGAIEAAYPLTDWGPPVPGMATPQGDLQQLLQAPIASLELEPIGPLAECLGRVLDELAAKGIAFQPAFYLGDGDFWTADRGLIVNVPWFLANPILWRLANRQQATAYTVDQVMKCLRHEAGHAVGYAYELYKRPDWDFMFGDFKAPYREVFPADGRSTSYVEYLTGVPDHYAQKHPDEDWAETFACWLDPESHWQDQYAGWAGALGKLEYVDRLLPDLQKKPVNTFPGRPVPYTALKGTVGQALGMGEGTQPFKGLAGWSEHGELLRREPHAYNAVALHESYFEALGGFAHREQGSWPPELLRTAAVNQWGSWESYLRDLRSILGTVSNGWAVTHFDPTTGRLRNAMVEGHASGLLAGAPLLLALDAFEHAYFSDYGTRKDVYLGALFQNIDWSMVAARYAMVTMRIPPAQPVPAPPPEPIELVDLSDEPTALVDPKFAERIEAELSEDDQILLDVAMEVISDPSAMAEEVHAAFEAVAASSNPEVVERFRAHVKHVLGETEKKGADRMEGRTPVEREVNRGGKIHRQIYWVREKDIRPTDRPVREEKLAAVTETQAAVLKDALEGAGKKEKDEKRYPELGNLTRTQIGKDRFYLRTKYLAKGLPLPAKVLAHLGAKDIDDLNERFKKAGFPPLDQPLGKARGTGEKPPVTAAAGTKTAGQLAVGDVVIMDPAKHGPDVAARVLSVSRSEVIAGQATGRVTLELSWTGGTSIKRVFSPDHVFQMKPPTEKPPGRKLIIFDDVAFARKGLPLVKPEPLPAGFKGPGAQPFTKVGGADLHHQIQTLQDETNQKALKSLGDSVQGLVNSPESTGVKEYAVDLEKKMQAAGTYNTGTGRVTLSERVMNRVSSIMASRKVQDPGDLQAVRVMLHENFHGASNNKHTYEGLHETKPTPGAAMEEATTEILAQHYAIDYAKNAMGVQVLGTAIQNSFTGNRDDHPLFEFALLDTNKSGDVEGRKASTSRSTSYQRQVEGFARMVQYVDQIKVDPYTASREELTAASDHIVMRAMQAKRLSDLSPSSLSVKEKGRPPRERYGMFVRPLLDRHGIKPDHPKFDEITRSLRLLLGDFVQGRHDFGKPKRDQFSGKVIGKPKADQSVNALHDYVKGIVAGKKYTGGRRAIKSMFGSDEGQITGLEGE